MFIYVLVTALTISSLILIMISDYQNMDNTVTQYEDQIESQQDGKPANEYWTKERMQEAEPEPMPTVSILDILKELIIDGFPVLGILFIILTAFLTLTNVSKIKLIEKQNENILKNISNENDTWRD